MGQGLLSKAYRGDQYHQKPRFCLQGRLVWDHISRVWLSCSRHLLMGILSACRCSPAIHSQVTWGMGEHTSHDGTRKASCTNWSCPERYAPGQSQSHPWSRHYSFDLGQFELVDSDQVRSSMGARDPELLGLTEKTTNAVFLGMSFSWSRVGMSQNTQHSIANIIPGRHLRRRH